MLYEHTVIAHVRCLLGSTTCKENPAISRYFAVSVAILQFHLLLSASFFLAFFFCSIPRIYSCMIEARVTGRVPGKPGEEDIDAREGEGGKAEDEDEEEDEDEDED